MSASPARIHIEHARAVCYAMEQNGVPTVQRLVIRNTGDDSLSGATVRLSMEPALAPAIQLPVPMLRPGAQHDFGVVDLPLAPGHLRGVQEAERAQLVGSLHKGEEKLEEAHFPIEVLAFNEWPGLRAPPSLLAAFATPNHPAVASLLQHVGPRLQAATNAGSIDGYQSKSPARAYAQVQALYDCVQALGLSYAGLPASFEETGQKVRVADVLVRDKVGNCLDLTLFLAACLEQMDLAPLLVLFKGHAVPAVWLIDDRFPEGVVNDAARLRTSIELGYVLVFDATVLVDDEKPPLEAARALAERRLKDDRAFECAVDVRVARRDGFRPMSLRLPGEDGTSGPTAVALAGAPRVSKVPSQIAPPVPSQARGKDPIRDRFRQWSEQLLDLSLRNKLLNFRSDAKSALPLEVPGIARFEDLLAADKVFDLLPAVPRDVRDERNPELQAKRIDPEERRRELTSDLERFVVHSTLQPDEMLNRAVHLDRTARADFEDGGANTLYVAVGLLRWYETKADDSRRVAPLLLVPVQLEYQRTTRRIRLRRLQEDSLPNYTLAEKLRRDYAVDLSGLVNIEPDESGLNVSAMLQSVRDAIRHMPRWEVDEVACLGLFTFTKFLMWRDLVTNTDALLESPVVRFLASNGATDLPSAPEPDPASLDHTVPPEALPVVVDSDSSQMSAVLSAMAGRSFVLQGPPGTGKSQTITNLIAAALYAGKRVLFVSEKMAALEVVHRRLSQVGLGDFCLELHSHKAQKREVIQSLGKVLERKRATAAHAWPERSRELATLRHGLNGYVRALHQPRPIGMSFFEATSRLVALQDAPRFRLIVPSIVDISGPVLSSFLDLGARLATCAREVQNVGAHPWRRSTHRQWSAALEEKIAHALRDALDRIAALRAASEALCRSLGVEPAQPVQALEQLAHLTRAVTVAPLPVTCLDKSAWNDLAERATRWRTSVAAAGDARTKLAQRWEPTLFELDLSELEPVFKKWAYAFFLFAWLFLWSARARMREVARGKLPANGQIVQDIQSAQKLLEAEKAIEDERTNLFRGFDGTWDGKRHDELGRLLDLGTNVRDAVQRIGADRRLPPSLTQLLAPTTLDEQRHRVRAEADAVLLAAEHLRGAIHSAVACLEIPAGDLGADGADYLSRIAGLFEQYLASLPRLRGWCQYVAVAEEARRRSLESIVQAHAAGSLPADRIEAAVERGLLDLWVTATRDGDRELRDFNGAERHRLVDRFRSVDREHINLGRVRVAATLEERLPAVSDRTSDKSEIGVLRREVQKKTRHMAIRKLFQSLPNVLPRLKPCLLMSPLSVAQYLPADAKRFDLVVFDEASQICTYDAVGAIARGNQVIVVGDSKQLPPTSFFKRGSSDDEVQNENDFDELESVLEEAKAAGLPEQMLTWHYRSRHEALIGFSNERYYDDRLNVFPAAANRVSDLGVHWHPVPNGVYERNKSRTNPVEAKAIVEYLVQQLRANEPGTRTFGIITFSQTQQELIADLLDRARGADPKIEAHFSDKLVEPVFIKNLENVQGDERDEVLFSIGYGPDDTGRVYMNFGPLNRQGGERRLNVAVTRARKALRVFSTLRPEHIDLARTAATGARHLKEFLQYVATHGARTAEAPTAAPAAFASAFDAQIAQALVERGYAVDAAIGCGAYRLDLAVRHPKREGVYALAVETDGPSYANAATARDRDRLRYDVLHGQRGLGWRLHRVWSTDWWFDRDREIARLTAAVEASLTIEAEPQPVEEPVVSASTADEVSDEDVLVLDESGDVALIEDEPAVVSQRSPVIPYKRANVTQRSSDPAVIFTTPWIAQIREVLATIIAVESPIHVDELCRRAGGAFGVARLSQRMKTRFVEIAPRAGISIRGDIAWAQGTSSFDAIRGPGADGYVRAPDYIAPQELANAAEWILSENISMPRADLVREMARVFGLQRAKATVAARMTTGIQALEQRGGCVIENETVSYREAAPVSRFFSRTAEVDPAPTVVERGPAPGPISPPPTPARPAPPETVPAQNALAVSLARSRVFMARTSSDQRRAQVLSLVAFLAERSGRAPLQVLAQELKWNPARVGGLIATLSEHLNHDGYEVLQHDASTQQVILDVEKLRILYALEC